MFFISEEEELKKKEELEKSELHEFDKQEKQNEEAQSYYLKYPSHLLLSDYEVVILLEKISGEQSLYLSE